MNKWIIEVQKDNRWKAFGYAEDEQSARQKAAYGLIKATRVYSIRIRRNE